MYSFLNDKDSKKISDFAFLDRNKFRGSIDVDAEAKLRSGKETKISKNKGPVNIFNTPNDLVQTYVFAPKNQFSGTLNIKEENKLRSGLVNTNYMYHSKDGQNNDILNYSVQQYRNKYSGSLPIDKESTMRTGKESTMSKYSEPTKLALVCDRPKTSQASCEVYSKIRKGNSVGTRVSILQDKQKGVPFKDDSKIINSRDFGRKNYR